MQHPRARFIPRAIRHTLVAAIAATPAILAAQETSLGDVVVTATRHAADPASLPATVTSLNREAMERRQPRDEADLFRDEPDLAMARDQRRFGATRVNIRGIEDNRVVQMVDGVRLPDYYNGGGPTNFTLSATPGAIMDFLKRVEVVRGPASSLYGSDAIGGVVGYLTLDPSDILAGDRKQGVRLRAGFSSDSNLFSSSVVGAFRGDVAELLIGYGEGHGEETATRGDNGSKSALRSKANPAHIDDKGLLAKLILRPATGHKLTATLEGREQDVRTDVRRLSQSLRKVTDTQGDDSAERQRFALEYEHRPSGLFYDRLLAKAYHQQSETHNYNVQQRTNTSASCSAASGTGNNCRVVQDFRFDQTVSGLNLQLESALSTAGIDHLLVYGIDLMRQQVEELRDATRYNLTTGTVSKTIAGETFPLRDFANGTTDTVGVFLQDEIGNLAGGRLSLTPGIRYDRTRLKPEVDDLSRPLLTSINREVETQTFSHFSPKIAGQWKFDPVLSAYGQVAAGFRAPNYNEVNGAFRNAGVPPGYAIAPNADLKPETSVGVELGLRLRGTAVRGQLAVYDNRYKDFIESATLSCPGDPRCITGVATTYMSLNLARVRIYGVELRSSWDFSLGWRLDGALAYAQGTDEERNQPLNSIEPARLSLALARDAGHWGAEGRLRAAVRKSRIDDSSGTVSDPVYFRTPGYAVVDLSGWFKPTRDTRVTVGVNNLFNQKYWLWSDIRQADARSPAGVEFYSQPGRTLRVAVQADF